MSHLFISLAPNSPRGFQHKIPTRHDLLGNSVALFTDSLDAPFSVLDDFTEVAQGIVITKGEVFSHTPIGSKLWHLVVTAEMISNLHELSRGFLDIMHQPPHKNELQRSLSESEEKYRLIFESSKGAILLLDPNGGYLDCNQSALDMFAIPSKKELSALGPGDLSPQYQPNGSISEEVVKKEIQITLEEGTNYFEWWHRGLNGREFPTTMCCSTIELDGRTIVLGTIRDITERKQTQKAMEFFQTAVETSTDAIGMATPDGKHWYQNNAFEQMFGDIGEDPCAAVYVDQSVGREVFQTIMNKKRWSGEVKMRGADNKIRDVSLRGYPVLDEENRVKNLIGVHTDITERKRTEKALRESEQKLKTLFASMNEMVVLHEIVFDVDNKATDYRITDCNDAFCTITGISKEAVIGKLATQIYQTDRAPYLEKFAKVATLGESTKFTVHYPPMDKQFIVSAVSPRKNHFATITTDITAIKQAERELTMARNYITNIIDSMPSVLMGVDSEGMVTQWNKTAEQVTGIVTQDAQGKKLSDVYPQMASQMKIISESIRTKETKQKRNCVYLKNSILYEDVTIYPLMANGVDGAVIRIDDVTEKVHLEEMMIQNEKMLSVGGLAAGMAHEINNPLAGMLQTANVMSHRLDKKINMPANIKAAEAVGISMEALRSFMEARGILRMIEIINDSGRRMADIVENMLSFARKSDARKSSQCLDELIDKTLELAATDYDLKKHYDFRQIQIIREYEKNLPLIPCEGPKIQQVLLNLLRNGAQAMQGAKIAKPQFVVRTRFEKEQKMAVIEIQDNGLGMSEAIRKRVFEPFFTTKPQGIGTGLGLSVSYFIITENHAGEMTVVSSPGQGTNFIIRLPLEGKGE